MTTDKGAIYLSGPMTGIPEFNFPLFDRVAAALRHQGWHVISPAEHDREVLLKSRGLGPEQVDGYWEGDVEQYSKEIGAVHDLLAWDLNVIIEEVDAIAMLPGWETSTGSVGERFCAETVGRDIHLWTAAGYRHLDPDQQLLHGQLKLALATRADRALVDRAVLPGPDVERPLAFLPSLQQALADRRGNDADDGWATAQHKAIAIAGVNALGLQPTPTPVIEERGTWDLDAYPSSVPEEKRIVVPEEERIVDPLTGGAKGRKLARWDLLPYDALLKVAEHYGRGAAKYEDRNWEKGYAWGLSASSLQNHFAAWWGGEEVDPEGFEHLVAVAWHALCLLTFSQRGIGTDDRPIPLFHAAYVQAQEKGNEV